MRRAPPRYGLAALALIAGCVPAPATPPLVPVAPPAAAAAPAMLPEAAAAPHPVVASAEPAPPAQPAPPSHLVVASAQPAVPVPPPHQAGGSAHPARPAAPPRQVVASARPTMAPAPPWRRPASDLTRQYIRQAGLSFMETGHSDTPLHIHAYLRIWYDGEPVEIPANLGIVDGRMAYMHTHDPSGTVHMEGPLGLTFTLGQFFTLWHVPLAGARVFERGKLVADPERLPLVDHTTLSIVYGRLPEGFGLTEEDEEAQP